ncbi:MAG: pyruvate formate lyase-activating protein [Thermogemmatispora sp.]|uniref:DUF1786 domain-containing protein n=1 Tax=Thermogemmatispora sp. TaxID=1968838 RepID=UPI001D3DC9BB|nr:DUF1786 family protein [Thermogemmatispora sp.]MBX5448985.1 pyruvate formate lyase-activating protein [Thermogemmatispora sp.]
MATAASVRVLAIDIGTGTQDILLFESGRTMENNVKLVMPSPTVIVAERIRRATAEGRPLLLTGVTMGGGPSHWAARDHALAGYPVAVTPEAARTFDDDLSAVAQMGFEIISEEEAAQRTQLPEVVHIELQDLDAQAIVRALRSFDLDPRVDALAIAAFDHGAAPPGYSDRRFRFEFLERMIRRSPTPATFAYLAEEIPPALTRLQAIKASVARYVAYSGSTPDLPVLLMDTGAAAALGALEDPLVRRQRRSLLCNIGNFHTLAFHLVEGRIVGLFEHHTGEINRTRLEELLQKLAAGTLTNDEVFYDSGHGALVLEPAPSGSSPASSAELPFLAVTGPRRELLRGSTLPHYEAVPHGDMMLAGCFGLLRALAERVPELGQAIRPALLNEANEAA